MLDITSDMIRRRHWIPSSSALLAFECAARHRNFSRAASELNTSQSAISRHVGKLEGLLATRLFDRTTRKLELTSAGACFYHTVVSALDNIQSSAMAVANASNEDQLVITCTHEISHLFVLPRFDALQSELGKDAHIRIMASDYDTVDVLIDAGVDLVFTPNADRIAPADRAMVFRDAVVPVCSPAYAKEHARVLAQPVSHWGALTFLNLTKPNRGWATWEDWHARVGGLEHMPEQIGFENYVYLLEAATAGRGLALGWTGCIGRYLDTGALVTLDSHPVEFDRAQFAALTDQGRQRELARRCLEFFRESAA